MEIMEEKEISIDGFKYTIKKIEFDFSKLDEDGVYPEYCDKSYVFFSDDEEPRIRIISYFNDDNNHRDSFDPYNYSEENIFVILDKGDESWELDKVYEILFTDNTEGKIKDPFSDGYDIHEDLKLIADKK